MIETTELHVPETMHIESDVPESNERPISARDRMMAHIAERAEEARHKEIAQGLVYESEARERGEALPPPTFEEEVEVDAAPPAAAPEPASDPAETIAHDPAPAPPHVVSHTPSLRTLNLNGQSVQVTEDQYAQLAQMGALAGMALTQQPQAQPSYESPPPAPVALDDTKIRDTVQRIQFGSPDEGAAALGGLIHDVLARVPAQPTVDQNALVHQATQRAVQEVRAQEMTAKVRAEFPKIFADTGLMALAHDRVKQIEQRDLSMGQRRAPIDIYREAGNQVYDLLKLPRPGSETPPPAPQAAPTVQPRAAVEERKRAAPRNPQPVARRSAVPAPPREASKSDIVAWLAKERGQTAPI